MMSGRRLIATLVAGLLFFCGGCSDPEYGVEEMPQEEDYEAPPPKGVERNPARPESPRPAPPPGP